MGFFLPPILCFQKFGDLFFENSNYNIFFHFYFLKFWFMIPIMLSLKCNLLFSITTMYQAYVAIDIHWP